MTQTEFIRLKRHITSLWGKSTKWDSATTAFEASPQVRNMDFQAAFKAAEAIAEEGSPHAPSIPQVVAKARQFTSGGGLPGPGECGHPGWGLIEADPRLPAEFPEVAVCRVCLFEVEEPSHIRLAREDTA